MMTPGRVTRKQAGEMLKLSTEGVRSLTRAGHLPEEKEKIGNQMVATIAIRDVQLVKAERDAKPKVPRATRVDTLARLSRENAERGTRATRWGSPSTDDDLSDDELRVLVQRAIDAGDVVKLGGYFYRRDESGEAVSGPVIDVDERVARIAGDLEAEAERIESSEQQTKTLAFMKAQNEAAQLAIASVIVESDYKANALNDHQLVGLCGRECSKLLSEAVRNGEIRRVAPPVGLEWLGDWLYNREDAIAFRARFESAKRLEESRATAEHDSDEMRLILAILRAASSR